MRATADDPLAAFSMGIDIRRVFSLSWSLAAVTAALSDVVIGTMGGISPQLGAIGLKVFPVVILGDWTASAEPCSADFSWDPRKPCGRVPRPAGRRRNQGGGAVPGAGGDPDGPPYGLFGTREIERL